MQQNLQPYDPTLPLLDQITALLIKYGHPDPYSWQQKVHPDVFTQPPEIQRFLINRYWRQEIGQYNEDTMDVRYCLIDQGRFEDWLRLFETGVIPCILRNTLPKSSC